MINSTPEGDGLDAPASFMGGLESLEHGLMQLRNSIETIQLYVQRVQVHTRSRLYLQLLCERVLGWRNTGRSGLGP